MKFNKLIVYIIAGVVTIILIYTLSEVGPAEEENPVFLETDEAYFQHINESRDQKDRFLSTAPDSPLEDEIKKSFEEISYFPIDTAYHILADFLPNFTDAIEKIQLNNGTSESYLDYGTLSFELKGETRKLTIYKSMDGEDLLFLPFTDLTNGQTTYGGGRYLEPQIVDPEKMLIDFNTAYNPYCAYNHDYVCPLPPPENHLTLAVEAGEKAFEIESTD